MNWRANSERYYEQKRLHRLAIDWWFVNHPGVPLDHTLASKEWCIAQGLDENYLELGTDMRIPNKWVVEKTILEQFEKCPFCGSRIDFEVLPVCSKVNPKQYSTLFACSNEDCSYYFYTSEPVLDVFEKASNGNFDSINKVFV